MGGDIVLPDSIDGDVAHTGEVVIKGQPSPAKAAAQKAAENIKYPDNTTFSGDAEEGLVEAKCPNLFKVGYVGLPRGPEFPIAEDLSTCTFSQIMATVKTQRENFAAIVKERLKVLEAQSSESVTVGSCSVGDGTGGGAERLLVKAKDGKPDDPVFYLSATAHARVRKLLEVFWKASPKAPAKTPLSLLYDYAMRTKADVLISFGQADEESGEESAAAIAEKLSGNTGFSVSVRLVSTADKSVIATGTGVMSNKKTAKQLAAASCIEALLSQGVKASAFTDKASKPSVPQQVAAPAAPGVPHQTSKGGKGGRKGENGKGGNATYGGRYANSSIGYSDQMPQYPNGAGVGPPVQLMNGKGVGGKGSNVDTTGFKGGGKGIGGVNKRDFGTMDGGKGLGKKGAGSRMKGQSGEGKGSNGGGLMPAGYNGNMAPEWNKPNAQPNNFTPMSMPPDMHVQPPVGYGEMYDHPMKSQRTNNFEEEGVLTGNGYDLGMGIMNMNMGSANNGANGNYQGNQPPQQHAPPQPSQQPPQQQPQESFFHSSFLSEGY